MIKQKKMNNFAYSQTMKIQHVYSLRSWRNSWWTIFHYL